MKVFLEEYLASVEDPKVRTLKELIKFNVVHAEQELPPSRYPSQNNNSPVANNRF
jgi:hypothetical protein